MILHHVTDDTKLIKVSSSPHCAKWLLESDGDRGDAIPVPNRLENRVCKSARQAISNSDVVTV